MGFIRALEMLPGDTERESVCNYPEFGVRGKAREIHASSDIWPGPGRSASLAGSANFLSSGYF
jgi:hypothetical protein